MIGLLENDKTVNSKINLIAQLTMGVLLLIGMVLARRKRYRAHGICQASVVILNLIPITTYMLPVFRQGVLSGISTKSADAFLTMAIAHATLGTLAELFGIYLILNAGTRLLPETLRLKNYKKWMRWELALWLLAIAFGIGIYMNWYG